MGKTVQQAAERTYITFATPEPPWHGGLPSPPPPAGQAAQARYREHTFGAEPRQMGVLVSYRHMRKGLIYPSAFKQGLVNWLLFP